ncbi:Transglycosylase SLT domain-containing protein [Methylomagnum ishizawai]|uniref:Transglycosylase SLT domain-containing protein n=1 Tax=Methylomagnum ishizawai TaxID=1760988 RepID=A0A1Y6CW52_9GAMM|nr:lytic transglycosylase domain-containing protein [Methylomagnum ishizawai]SMF94888.1 Transglycosylase SLT domain-containing protein [Methylomagnum ishizawai]
MSRVFRGLPLALLTCFMSHGVQADVYKYINPVNGHVEYTDKPNHKGFHRIIETPEPFTRPAKVTFGGKSTLGNKSLFGGGLFGSAPANNNAKSAARHAALERNRSQYAGLIAEAANRHGLDPALLHAVIRAESSYNPGAVSNKGAIGMMQLMPATAARYGVQDPYDPVDNVYGGARYLSDLLGMFSDVPLAVAAYNAGENNVIKYGHRIPPFQETQNYVSRVLGYYNRFD